MKKTLTFMCLMALVLLSSCVSRKNLTYLQDMEELRNYPVYQKYEPIIHRDDRLNITVSCKNPELTLPFNIPGSSNYSVGIDGSITSISSGPASIDNKNKGYLVDINGEIDFPILGRLKVEGSTRKEVTEMIKARLIAEDLIKDPIVMVDFQNFKITVLGEVGKTGTIEVSGDRITLLEAIAQAGDVSLKGNPSRVAVIRENGNHRSIYYHNLRSKDVFNSPYYYLQQNDIVYVEPSANRTRDNFRDIISIVTTGASFITTIVSLILMATN